MSETPSSIFWIRRAIVLVALIAIVGLVGFGISALFGATNTADSEQQQTETADANEAEPEEAEISECLPGTVNVTAEIGDADGEVDFDFNPTELPHMWYTITNNSGVDCKFNVGSAVTFFEITSGDELIWTSRDCDRSEDTNEIGILKAGATLASPPMPWEKVRSSDTGCGAGQSDVITGGASYFLSVEVNGVLSKEDAPEAADSDPQFLLY
ncbi:MAG TPA: hypothetical protein VIB61_00895 [Microbacteriaceae bacterium]